MYIMGEGSGRGSDWVGSGQTICRQSRVGSGQRFAGSGRVGSKKSDPWTTLVIDIKFIKKFLLELKMHHYRWLVVVVVVEFTLAT